MLGGEHLSRQINPILRIVPEGAKDIYTRAAGAVQGISVFFFHQDAGWDRQFKKKWYPMMRITADPGVPDYQPFWDKVKELEAETAD